MIPEHFGKDENFHAKLLIIVLHISLFYEPLLFGHSVNCSQMNPDRFLALSYSIVMILSVKESNFRGCKEKRERGKERKVAKELLVFSINLNHKDEIFRQHVI